MDHVLASVLLAGLRAVLPDDPRVPSSIEQLDTHGDRLMGIESELLRAAAAHQQASATRARTAEALFADSVELSSWRVARLMQIAGRMPFAAEEIGGVNPPLTRALRAVFVHLDATEEYSVAAAALTEAHSAGFQAWCTAQTKTDPHQPLMARVAEVEAAAAAEAAQAGGTES